MVLWIKLLQLKANESKELVSNFTYLGLNKYAEKSYKFEKQLKCFLHCDLKLVN